VRIPWGVALNFAISAGERGRRVLLVEGDDRQNGGEAAEAAQGVKKNDAGDNSNSIFRTPWHGVKVMQVRANAKEGNAPADRTYEALLVSVRDYDLVLLDGSQVLPDQVPDQTWRRALSIDDVILVIHRNLGGAARIGKALQAAKLAPEKVTGAVLVG
jgi:hypothetical protein